MMDTVSFQLVSGAEKLIEPHERVLRSSLTQSPWLTTWQDLSDAWRQRGLWVRLGYLEVRRRYKRTVLGPFWATAHIALYIVCVGFVFSSVLSTDRATYIPYLTTGFIAWTFVYQFLSEASGAFTGASSMRQQLPLPYFVFIFTTMWRCLVVHLH